MNDHCDDHEAEQVQATFDLVVDNLQSMLHQERSYVACNYLCIMESDDRDAMSVDWIDGDTSECNNMMDESCRSAMSAWVYNVVDSCHFPRNTAALTMNYVDRFLSTPAGKPSILDRSLFQLTCMTCLYVAVKIHCPAAMDPRLVSTLSRGVFSEEQIESMEMVVLAALKWKVNPPTATVFLEHFDRILVEEQEEVELFHTVLELAKYQAQVAVNEYDLSVGVKPSTLAAAALANALESVNMMERSDQIHMLNKVVRTAEMEVNTRELHYARTRLYEAVMGKSGESLTTQTNTTTTTTSLREQSHQHGNNSTSSSGSSSSSRPTQHKGRFCSGSSPRSASQELAAAAAAAAQS